MTTPRFILFTALALSLLLVWGCATNSQKELAGRINGTPIPYSDFIDAYRGHYNNFQVLNNRVPDGDERDLIRQQTWTDATKHVILTDLFAQYKISATPAEVLDTLRQSVPGYILKSPVFATDGKFDRALYHQSLEFDNPQNLAPLRKNYLEYVVPIQKLKELLIDRELLTKNERKLAEKVLQTRADIVWTVLDEANLDPVVTDEEINFYYAQNKEDYKLDPYYRLGWTSIPVSFSDSDTRSSKTLADSLHAELAAGDSPEDAIARRQSYFPQLTYKNAGFQKNTEIGDDLYALFARMEEGEYTKPLPQPESVLIHRLDTRTKSMSSFHTLVIPYIASQRSISASKPHADNIARLISELGPRATAEEMSLSFWDSGRLKPGSPWLDDPKLSQELLDALPGKPDGYVFPPLYYAREQAWLVVYVQENRLENYSPVEKVKDDIRARLATQKRRDMTQRMADQIVAGTAVAPASARVLQLTGMTPQTPVLGHSLETVFFRALRSHYQKERQSWHRVGRLIFIPTVLSAKTDKKVKPSAADIRRQFASTLASDWFDAWLAKRVAKARVEIFTD